MKPSIFQPATLSLAFWATASISHAQALPATVTDTPDESDPDSPPQLVSMAQSEEEVSTSLTPMVEMSTSPTIYLQPILTAMESKPVQPPAQLVQMAPRPTEPKSTLLAMESKPAQTPVQLVEMSPRLAEPKPILVAMATPVQVGTDPLKPMVKAAQDGDVTLTPLYRRGKAEIMRGSGSRFGNSVVGPVTGLEALPPPLEITPTGKRAIVLPLPPGTIRPMRPVTALEGTVTTVAPESTFSTNPLNLTNAELSPNPNIPTITRPEEEMLSVDIILNGIPRKNLIDVYLDAENTLWLPLTSLSRLLEIPLSINPAAGVAQGWYQSPSNTLLISMAKGTTTIGSQGYMNAGEVEKHTTDLYVTANAFKKWLGVDVTLDYSQLQLRITTPNPLPGDLRAARESKWDAAEKARAAARMPSDTIIPEYSNFSLPIVRLGLNANYIQSPGADAATATGLTVQAQNDIMGMNSNVAFSLARNSDGTQNLSGGSILLQKQSENPDLLGPLGARYFGFGDITTNPLVLSGLSNSGRGLRVNNTPRGAVSNPDQYVLNGPAPIGWDVEVYQNQTLVGFSRINASGMYRFTALPLRSGRNQFRIVLYGPNGEREERRESIYLGNNIPDVGEWQYDAALYQPNQHIIPGVNTSIISNSSVTAQAQLTTGLTSRWAATLGAFQSAGVSPYINGVMPPQQGATAGLRGSLDDTYITADILGSTSGQSAQASIRTPLTDALDLRLTQTRNAGYTSDERDELSITNAEIGYPFKWGKTALDTTYGYTHTTYQTQKPRDTYSQRTSTNIGKVNATNQLNYEVQGNSNVLDGTVEATTRIMDTSVRGGLTYQPTSNDPLRQLTLATQLPVLDNQTLNLTYNQQLTSDKNASLVSSLNWPAGPWLFGVQSQLSSNGNNSIGLNLATALVPNGYDQVLWKLAPPNATLGQGQAAVRVFIDENANARYDVGEPLIPNVTVFNRLRGTQATTNAQGIAKFSDLTPNTLTRIDLDPTTLPDIYLKPVSETLNVKPHTGDNGVLNYAITLYGEISGQALTPSGQPLQNLQVSIFNGQGNKIDSTFTEYDGYYSFGALPMGTYSIHTQGSGSMAPATITVAPKTRIQRRNLTINLK